MKLLLSSVFGPFGVNDEYGEKENKMELFHNQVTREQGLFSYRFNHASHGLYFIAKNISAPTTVLDFPNLNRFIKEIKKGYEYVGISFIVPNFKKAKKMAELVRKHAPKSKIILGSHGVSIPGIENMIEHDLICRGEGIGFFRKLFNEKIDAPFKHPLTFGAFNREVMGTPWASNTGILITGVGCANKCRFCATSHYFGEYTPYLKTGQEIFDVCCEYEDEKGITDFGILDENFLKTKDRALEFLEVMEREKRYFSFAIFSSAETLASLDDLDILVRMGVSFIWIGVESKKEVYEKNAGTDFTKLFHELQKRGITIMASAILFLEEHDKKTIWSDIDFVTALNPDYLQFMQLGPIPGTALYKDYDEQGKLLKDVPYDEQHGQKKIWFKHEEFTQAESESYLKRAFQYDYRRNGASILRAIRTNLRGVEYCQGHNDPMVQNRAKDFVKTANLMRYFIFSSRFFSENDMSTTLTNEISDEFNRLIGKPTFKTFLLTILVFICACKEAFRIKFFGDVRQPPTLTETYNLQVQKKPSLITKIEGHKKLKAPLVSTR